LFLDSTAFSLNSNEFPNSSLLAIQHPWLSPYHFNLKQ
jgi:hypothetical protein